MDINELKRFIDINKSAQNAGILGKYQKLREVLQHNQNRNNQKVPFDQQRQDLIDAVKKFNIDTENTEIIQLFDRMGYNEVVGVQAAESIEDIFYKNNLDIVACTNKVEEKRQKLESLFQLVNNLDPFFQKYVKVEEAEYEEALVHLRFTGQASISNFVDLKRWGSDWHDIVRGVTMFSGTTPESIRVLGARNGSLIFDLAVGYGVVKIMSMIVNQCLKVAERYIEVKKKAEELRKLRLDNDKIAQQIDDEADAIESKGVDSVLAQVLQAYPKVDGEKENALKIAVVKVFEFVKGGGEVDVHIDYNETTEQQDTKLLKQEIMALRAQMRETENKIIRLEHKQ